MITGVFSFRIRRTIPSNRTRSLEAVLNYYTDGVRYQVDFGNSQTAMIRGWQIVKE
jgi:hypothetical protein